MISRRKFLGTPRGASATLALTPELVLRAFQPSGGKLIQRAIPSSGEMLPAISCGARPTDPAAIEEIVKTLLRLHNPGDPSSSSRLTPGGTVTGLILEQGNLVERIPLTRIRR